ncbi:phosphoribosyltransferase [Pontibacter liquoris]|uniref:phosphoribosyltransferase n=1 Tax=Pontibacter liquoris TaxID=2905677 RepID=UPI001FA6E4A7|nr:phosphoribosyltransferase family protein [Pontibacter liquoris]
MEMLQNRQEAAELLADRLARYKGENGVVLAIPRGGVPIGAVIARALAMPLDIALSKKIGHPANPEFAIGAVSLETLTVDERAEVPRQYIDAEVKRVRESLQQKYKLFMGNRQHQSLQDKVVIIADDGIATGKTLLTTVELVKNQHPRKVIIAVPVAPFSAIDKFRKLVDEVVCLLVPPFFQAVGQFYREFDQVSDEEVIALLQEQAW